MGERKVINKYYPPDFDPELIPRARRRKDAQIKLPMSIRCTQCGEYLGKGKKFNAKKETATGEEYLGLKVFRFYIRCVRCSAEITIKTDPKNSDYVAERNCIRNFEPWHEHKELMEEEEEDDVDPMQLIEERTEEMKQELETLDILDDIKTMNAVKQKVSVDEMLKMHRMKVEKEKEEEEKLTKEEEEEIKKMFHSSETVKRIDESSTKTEEKKEEKKKEDEKKIEKKSTLDFNFIKISKIKKKRKMNKKKPLVNY